MPLGRQRDSQFTQWIFCSSPWAPYQKRAIREFISFNSCDSRRKTLIVYVGIACTTTLMNISFPGFDNDLSFHPWIFFHTRVYTFANAAFLDLPSTMGNPKYLSCAATSFIPILVVIPSLRFAKKSCWRKSPIHQSWSSDQMLVHICW